MTEDHPIAWEPHPVTQERKAELRAQGYRILDARFKPDDLVEDADDARHDEADGEQPESWRPAQEDTQGMQAAPKRRGRPPKAAAE